ncbi:DUF4268 domain-containing protein [Paraflavitalea pollutisoli]|uniref:DUF4268 domain-containing protein n=1 Tax=Paraflavitalea pollutisoli TaxID=3034143 RepID=UPI0023EB277F|nr:DUF4268 domain-containing protein [Paraflavitalea sp. H1-2-19X]
MAYTREEASKITQSFWTSFGRYMQPVTSVDGLPVNWINYKTGINGISFKMDADRDQAMIMIQLSHSNTELRHAHYEQLVQLKAMLEEALGEDDWLWKADRELNGRIVSTVSKSLEGVNILRQTDWPTIISFLKPRIIALDALWSTVKHSFE